jgi:hypothetical protein
MKVEQLIIRESIRDTLAQYCRGIDRRDRGLAAACFHPDATDDHGTGPRPIDEFIEWCFDLLAAYDSTFHFLGQTLITVDADLASARAESYGIAHHRTTGGADHHNLITGFRYLDTLSPGAETWLIRHRRAVTDWSRVDRSDQWWAVPDRMLRGLAGPDDPSYD